MVRVRFPWLHQVLAFQHHRLGLDHFLADILVLRPRPSADLHCLLHDSSFLPGSEDLALKRLVCVEVLLVVAEWNATVFNDILSGLESTRQVLDEKLVLLQECDVQGQKPHIRP